MNDASVFVALLDDVVLDLGGPARIILSGNGIRAVNEMSGVGLEPCANKQGWSYACGLKRLES